MVQRLALAAQMAQLRKIRQIDDPINDPALAYLASPVILSLKQEYVKAFLKLVRKHPERSTAKANLKRIERGRGCEEASAGSAWVEDAPGLEAQESGASHARHQERLLSQLLDDIARSKTLYESVVTQLDARRAAASTPWDPPRTARP